MDTLQRNYVCGRLVVNGFFCLLICYAVQGQVELVEDFENYALETSLDQLSEFPGARWQSAFCDASKIGLATASGGGNSALQLDTLGAAVRFRFDDVAVTNQLAQLDLLVKWQLCEELPWIEDKTALTALAVNSDCVICAYLARNATEKGWVAFRNGSVEVDSWSRVQIMILETNSVGRSKISFKINDVFLEDETGCMVFDSLRNVTNNEPKDIHFPSHESFFVLFPDSLSFTGYGEIDNLSLFFKPRAHVVVSSTPVSVPYMWLSRYFGVHFDDREYEELTLKNGANQRPLWESYVAGLNPTNAASEFQMHIAQSNGISCLWWSPHHPDRAYTVLGKTNLTDATWHFPTNSGSHFFKVNVALP